MKNIRFFTFVLTVATLVLSACGTAAATAMPAPIATSGAVKVDAMPVSFVGIVDSIAGDQWIISGTKVTVDASVVRDGPFSVGDRIKVEGLVNPDGSLTISRVESPTPQETATLPPVSADNSNEAAVNANTNDSNANDTNVNDGNINDDNSSGVNSNDDNGNDDNGGGNTNDDDNSNASNDNGDDHGGDNGNDDKGGDDSGGGNDDNSNDD